MPRLWSGKIISYLLLLHFLDISILPLFIPYHYRPILTFLMLLYAVLEWHWENPLWIAFVIGLLRDLSGTLPLGVETSALIVSSAFLSMLAPKIDRESFIIRIITTFLFVFFDFFIMICLSRFLRETILISGYSFLFLFVSAVFTAALAPLFFNLTARWFGDRAIYRQYELFR